MRSTSFRFFRLAWLCAGLFLTIAAFGQAPATNAAASAPSTNARPLLAFPEISVTNHAYLTFGLNKVDTLQAEVLGNPLWQYLAFAIYIALAFLVSKVFDLVLGVWLKRLARRTETETDDMVIELLRGPAKVIAFVVLMHIGLSLFKWPAVMERLLGKMFILIVAFSITYVFLKLVDVLVGQWIRRFVSHDDKSLREALVPIVRGALKGFLLIIAILMTLQNMGVDITGILASLSVVGLALGLAAQDTVANLFGTFTIFIDKPFKIGDRIQLSGVDGTVEQINLRSTRVRNLDGHLVTIPNKTMGNATITNVSQRPNIKTTLVIGITYSTPTVKVKEAVDILRDIFIHPKTHDVLISFKQFADSSLNIEVVHWFATSEVREYTVGIEAFNLQIKERFDKAGIEFAFPTRTLLVKQDSDWKMEAPAKTGN